MGGWVDNDSASKSAVWTRRGWHQLQGAIDDGTVKAVAIWKLDRANRVAWKNLEWLARCAELGVRVVSFSDPEMATQDSSTKILVALKSPLAEFETDMMSTRQLSAKAHAAEAGFNHGGMRPIGWMPATERETDEHGRSGFLMIPHPLEFPAVQDAIAMCLAGHGLHEIALHLGDGPRHHDGRRATHLRGQPVATAPQPAPCWDTADTGRQLGRSAVTIVPTRTRSHTSRDVPTDNRSSHTNPPAT